MKRLIFISLILSILIIGCAQKVDGDFKEITNIAGSRIEWHTSSGVTTSYILILIDSPILGKSRLTIRKYDTIVHYLDNKHSDEQIIDSPKVENIVRQNGKIVSITVNGKTFKAN